MKGFVKKNLLNVIIAAAAGLAAAVSFILPIDFGIQASKNFASFFKELITLLPPMFILIGLFDVWFPKEKVEKHIGKESGVKGILYVVLLAMLQVGPLYGAFPVCYMLWKKGCSVRNVFIFLGAYSTLKIPMLTFEIGFMGVWFSVLRTIISLPIFILIGFIMDWVLKGKDFQIKTPG